MKPKRINCELTPKGHTALKAICKLKGQKQPKASEEALVAHLARLKGMA